MKERLIDFYPQDYKQKKLSLSFLIQTKLQQIDLIQQFNDVEKIKLAVFNYKSTSLLYYSKCIYLNSVGMSKRDRPTSDQEENTDTKEESRHKKRKHNQIQEVEDLGNLEKFVKNQKTIALLKKKGVKSLFKVQYMTYQAIYNGEDIIGRDKTGSGKTLAFSLPIIERMRKDRQFQKNHLAKFLIVLPTRQLALQVKDQIESLRFVDEPDFRVVAVYGKDDINRQIGIISKGIDIIVGTPGRIIDLLERGVIKTNQMKVVCLDEADQMLKIGFKESIQKIYEYIKKNAPKKTQNLLFSATIPPWVTQISETYQDKNCKFINLIRDKDLTTPDTLTHYCLKINIGDQYLKSKIISNLIKKYAVKSGNTIIFCERKSDVQLLSSSLNQYGHKSEALHGDVHQSKREAAYRRFKQGALKCLIATNVAARGLDFPQIDIVIQADPPNNVEPYIHRSGRTARKGNDGICITLYTDKTERLVKSIQNEAKISMKKLYAQDFLQKIVTERENQYYSGPSVEKDRDRNRNNRRQQEQDRDYEVYVKYFPKDKTDNDVREYFENKGVKVRSVKILKNGDQSKGCGFVKIGSKKDQDKCLACNQDQVDGRRIQVTIPKQK